MLEKVLSDKNVDLVESFSLISDSKISRNSYY